MDLPESPPPVFALDVRRALDNASAKVNFGGVLTGGSGPRHGFGLTNGGGLLPFFRPSATFFLYGAEPATPENKQPLGVALPLRVEKTERGTKEPRQGDCNTKNFQLVANGKHRRTRIF